MAKFNIQLEAHKTSFDSAYELTLTAAHGRYSGVYVMFDSNDAVIYVGKSQDLGVRMKAHKRSSAFFSEVERLELYACEGGYAREMLETYLINELRPLRNKSKTYFREIEYADEIEEIDYEIGELLTEVADLKRDREGVVVTDDNMYDKDTATSDRRFILGEIRDKSDIVAELRSRRHLLIMRVI